MVVEEVDVHIYVPPDSGNAYTTQLSRYFILQQEEQITDLEFYLEEEIESNKINVIERTRPLLFRRRLNVREFEPTTLLKSILASKIATAPDRIIRVNFNINCILRLPVEDNKYVELTPETANKHIQFIQQREGTNIINLSLVQPVMPDFEDKDVRDMHLISLQITSYYYKGFHSLARPIELQFTLNDNKLMVEAITLYQSFLHLFNTTIEEYNELVRKYNELSNILNNLYARDEELKNELDYIYERRAKLGEEYSSLNNELRAVNTQINQLERTITILQGRIGGLTTLYNRLQRELQQREEMLKTAREQLEKATRPIDRIRLGGRIGALTRIINNLKNRITNTEERVAETMNRLSKSESQLAELKERRNELIKLIQANDNEANSLLSKENTINAERRDINQAIRANQSEHTNINAKLNSLASVTSRPIALFFNAITQLYKKITARIIVKFKRKAKEKAIYKYRLNLFVVYPAPKQRVIVSEEPVPKIDWTDFSRRIHIDIFIQTQEDITDQLTNKEKLSKSIEDLLWNIVSDLIDLYTEDNPIRGMQMKEMLSRSEMYVGYVYGGLVTRFNPRTPFYWLNIRLDGTTDDIPNLFGFLHWTLQQTLEGTLILEYERATVEPYDNVLELEKEINEELGR